MLLYVLRHGEPDYETDTLTEMGKLQADALAKRLVASGIDKVYSSPLGRAKETAKPTCDLLGLTYEIEDWASEDEARRDFGGILPNGRKGWCYAQQNTILKNDKTINLQDKWYEADCFSMIDGKSGYERIIEGSDRFLKKLGYEREGCIYRIVRPSEERVAIFCHEGFGLTWMSHLLQIPPHIFWASFEVTFSSMSVFEFKNNKDGYTAPKCLCFSDTSHIFKYDLPLEHNNRIKI